MALEGRRAFVTGGSGDIGSAIAAALARAGANVALSYVGFKAGAERTAEQVRRQGRQAFCVPLDQRDPNAVGRAVDSAAEHLGGLDILVNNAAWNVGIPFPNLEALDPETWDRVLTTNLRGPYLLARAAARYLETDTRGTIVNIASTAGYSPTGSSIAYACSKAGLIHLTKCLAVALAPRITVNCVAPGLVEGTRMASRLPEAAADRAREQAVLGRVGCAEDVARHVVTLSESETVTGQTLVVDGGMPAAMR